MFPERQVSRSYICGHDCSGRQWRQMDPADQPRHVLVEIARDPTARLRDIAAVTGLTERAVQVSVADLEAAGYLTLTPPPPSTASTVTTRSATAPSKASASASSPTCSPPPSPPTGTTGPQPQPKRP